MHGATDAQSDWLGMSDTTMDATRVPAPPLHRAWPDRWTGRKFAPLGKSRGNEQGPRRLESAGGWFGSDRGFLEERE
jgi:hypothetical protein